MTTFGPMPLAIGIFIRRYYDKVLKDNIKGFNREVPRASAARRVVYNAALSLT